MLFKSWITITKTKTKEKKTQRKRNLKEGFKANAVHNNEMHWLRIDRSGQFNSRNMKKNSELKIGNEIHSAGDQK